MHGRFSIIEGARAQAAPQVYAYADDEFFLTASSYVQWVTVYIFKVRSTRIIKYMIFFKFMYTDSEKS